MDWIFGSSYRVVRIRGIDYHAYRTKNVEEDTKAAYKLAYLNDIARQVMKYLRIYIQNYKSGTLRADDMYGVDINRVIFIQRTLVARYCVDQIYEVTPTDDNKSYVLDLGREIHLCVRSDDKSALVAVLIHELAHVGNEGPEHDDSFWWNHAILSRLAKQIGVISIAEVPLHGTIHCGRIEIPYKEVADMAYEPSTYPQDHHESSYHRVLSNPHITSSFHPFVAPPEYQPDVLMPSPKIMTGTRATYRPSLEYGQAPNAGFYQGGTMYDFSPEETVMSSQPTQFYPLPFAYQYN